ncbi:hypothetical protein BJ508DRAFT_315513 [Ascobolus immersus RN42]|uniref:Uncharacterized protein n=1 Tax=Ascobolus immersus RN42 TaxID=1160509 RepID=A0A3N4HAH0_ASCIM|nr:hypothetical protein BJ508DRAFT_315513 [Ascobolus immersus RN42]
MVMDMATRSTSQYKLADSLDGSMRISRHPSSTSALASPSYRQQSESGNQRSLSMEDARFLSPLHRQQQQASPVQIRLVWELKASGRLRSERDRPKDPPQRPISGLSPAAWSFSAGLDSRVDMSRWGAVSAGQWGFGCWELSRTQDGIAVLNGETFSTLDGLSSLPAQH